jgi:osmoprotectant transport system substrate-binding protein
MPAPGSRVRRLAAALTLVLLAGCGLQTASGFAPTARPGLIRPVPGASGSRVTVAGKNFTEQLVLGKIGVLALRAAGFDVVDHTDIPGSVASRAALLHGEADVQWEYTGTAWIAYLGHERGIPDPRQQWLAVRAADASHGLTWLPTAPLNNTYGLAIRPDAPGPLRTVRRISQIAGLPVPLRTFCVETEFASRNDGFEPMLKAYGMPLGAQNGVPRGNVRLLDAGAIYLATDSGTCNFGEIFTTDGRIKALRLTVLADDRHFFPAYNAAPVVRTRVLEEHPQIAGIFARIAPLLNDRVMIELNRQVDVDGNEPADVAYRWMRSTHLVT